MSERAQSDSVLAMYGLLAGVARLGLPPLIDIPVVRTLRAAMVDRLARSYGVVLTHGARRILVDIEETATIRGNVTQGVRWVFERFVPGGRAVDAVNNVYRTYGAGLLLRRYFELHRTPADPVFSEIEAERVRAALRAGLALLDDFEDGDLNALIDLSSKRPADAPVAVYMIYNTPPFTVVVKQDSPIRSPRDLEGKTVGGPANDAALKLFPAYARLAKIDASKVNITNMAPNLREQMLMRGQVDAVFGFITTVTFSARAMGLDPAKDLRFIRYGDSGMDLYSNAVFFSRNFVRDNPKAVQGFLRALTRAMRDVIAGLPTDDSLAMLKGLLKELLLIMRLSLKMAKL